MKRLRVCSFFLLLASVTTGCSYLPGGYAKQTYSPSGKTAYTIQCNGYYNSWALCLDLEGQKCGSRGYDILDRLQDKGVGRSLLIECN